MVHGYQLNGYNIIIDANSGSVHSVDELAYAVILRYETQSREVIVRDMLALYSDCLEVTKEEIEDIFADIEELKSRKKLFSDDIFKDLSVDIKKIKPVVKAMCIHIAHDCNLACKYCFAGKGEYCGPRSLMSAEVGKRALDFLLENSGTRRNLEVDFFGGEPLLNFGVVKELVAYGREREKEFGKNFRFTLTTNGVLLNDDVIEFANREMSNVVLSLDGRPEVHDRLRVTRSGGGSYAKILPAFKKISDARGQENYHMRGTFTRFNKDFSQDILHMADLGFKQLAMEPVVAPAEEPYALREEDTAELCEQYELLAVEMLKRDREGRGFNFYHYLVDLQHGPCIKKRLSGCGVGREYLAVTPEGDFYPCHQFVGDERFILGNVREGITNQVLRDEFAGCNVYSKPECADCFAKLYCSGGCAANSFNSTGDLNGNYKLGCDLHRKRIECALMMRVAESCEAPKPLRAGV